MPDACCSEPGLFLLEQSDCMEINVSGLAEGVYIVKLQSGSNGHTLFKKFVKYTRPGE